MKSWLILDYGSATTMGPRLDSVRMLWEAILNRRKRAASRFQWEDLCSEDISQAELLMRTHWSESTSYKRIVNIIAFAEFLAARGITSGLRSTTDPKRRGSKTSTVIRLRASRNGAIVCPPRQLCWGLADALSGTRRPSPGTGCGLPRSPSSWSLVFGSASC